MIDPIAIPNRLEQPIGEPERHDVLNGVLAQKVIYPKYLVLMQRATNHGVQRARGIKAVAKWLLDHDATPKPASIVAAGALVGELRFTQSRHHVAEKAIGDSQIENRIGRRAVADLVERAAKLLVKLGVGEVAADVRHSLRKSAPRRFIDVVDVEPAGRVPHHALEHFAKMVAPTLWGFIRPGDADQRELFRQQSSERQVVESGRHQALGQVACSAEDHHGARIRLRRLIGLRLGHGSTPRLGTWPSDRPICNAADRRHQPARATAFRWAKPTAAPLR